MRPRYCRIHVRRHGTPRRPLLMDLQAQCDEEFERQRDWYLVDMTTVEIIDGVRVERDAQYLETCEEQQPRRGSGMTPLVCSCGCGRSLEGRPTHARYTTECAAKRLTRKVWRGREREERRALNPTQHVVIHRYDVNPHHPQRLCQVCSGMPWRRDGICRGCGEPPGEEQIERGSALRSSAGTAARHGEYHGY